MHAFCGVPGLEGVSYSHVRGRQLIIFYEYDATSEPPPRDEQLIQGVNEYAVFGCVRARGVILLFNSFT